MKFMEEYYSSIEKNSLRSPNSLDFLNIKKSIKGFSVSFWILISNVFVIYIGLNFFWYDALPKTLSNALPSIGFGLYEKTPNNSLIALPENSVVKNNIDIKNNDYSKKGIILKKEAEKVFARRSPIQNSDVTDNDSLSSSDIPIKSISNSQNPKVLLAELDEERIKPKLTARKIIPNDIKTKRVRTQYIDVLPKKTPSEGLASGSVEVARPKYQQLYGSAAQALSAGRLNEANQLIDEALYIKDTPEAHAFKLRLYLLIAVEKVTPYIAQHQLPIESSSELMAIYAQANQKLGNYDKSLWAYEQLVVLEPLHEGWFLGLALSLEQLGKVEAALKSYYKAIQLTQDSQLQHFAQQRIGHLKNLLP